MALQRETLLINGGKKRSVCGRRFDDVRVLIRSEARLFLSPENPASLSLPRPGWQGEWALRVARFVLSCARSHKAEFGTFLDLFSCIVFLLIFGS